LHFLPLAAPHFFKKAGAEALCASLMSWSSGRQWFWSVAEQLELDMTSTGQLVASSHAAPCYQTLQLIPNTPVC